MRIAAALALILSCTAALAQEPDPSGFPCAIPAAMKDAPVRIEINTRSTTTLKPLMGFNTQFLASRFTYDDPTFGRAVGELRPGAMRFPAGTVGNFYDWRKDGFVTMPDTAYDWVRRGVVAFELRGKKYGYEGFRALVKQQGIQPVWMANILHQTPDDIVAWLSKLKADGLDISRVELGNEIYIKGQNTPATASADGYTRTAKAFAEAIRKAHPGTRVAVCATPPLGDWKRPDWNETLAKETFYDAVVHHDYRKFDERKGAEPGSPAAIRNALSPESVVDGFVEELTPLFRGKPLWITEWNVAIGDLPAYQDTSLCALYSAGFCLRMLDHPAEIELALFHKIVSGMGLFEIDRDGTVTKRPAYAAFVLIDRALDGGDARLATRVTPEAPPEWGFPPFAVAAVRSKAGTRILLINKLPLERKVEIIVDGKPWTGASRVSWFGGAEKLMDKPPVLNAGSGIVEKPFTGSVTVPRFSISLIELPATGR